MYFEAATAASNCLRRLVQARTNEGGARYSSPASTNQERSTRELTDRRAADGTGSSRRRGTSTNAPNDRVLRSTDNSLDDLIQNPPVRPLPTLDNQPKRQADVAVLSSEVRQLVPASQLLSLVGVESAVPSFVFSLLPLTGSTCSPSCAFQARYRCPRCARICLPPLFPASPREKTPPLKFPSPNPRRVVVDEPNR
jgi:hypothetical protein